MQAYARPHGRITPFLSHSRDSCDLLRILCLIREAEGRQHEHTSFKTKHALRCARRCAHARAGLVMISRIQCATSRHEAQQSKICRNREPSRAFKGIATAQPIPPYKEEAGKAGGKQFARSICIQDTRQFPIQNCWATILAM